MPKPSNERPKPLPPKLVQTQSSTSSIKQSPPSEESGQTASPAAEPSSPHVGPIGLGQVNQPPLLPQPEVQAPQPSADPPQSGSPQSSSQTSTSTLQTTEAKFNAHPTSAKEILRIVRQAGDHLGNIGACDETACAALKALRRHVTPYALLKPGMVVPPFDGDRFHQSAMPKRPMSRRAELCWGVLCNSIVQDVVKIGYEQGYKDQVEFDRDIPPTAMPGFAKLVDLANTAVKGHRVVPVADGKGFSLASVVEKT